MAAVLAVPIVAAVPAVASAAVRITKVSASPYYVSRLVAPKRLAIRYTLSGHTHVIIEIRNSSGAGKKLLSSAGRNAGANVSYWDLKYSSGAWAAGGRYTISIYGVDARGHHSSPYPAKVYCNVDNTLPSAGVSGVSRYSLSTTVGETTTVSYRLSDNNTTAKLTSTLEVVNAAGAVVRSIVATGVVQGTGRTFVWNGKTAVGSAVAPGAYSARIRVKDLAGNQYVSPLTFLSRLHVNAWSRERALDKTVYTDMIMRADMQDDLTHIVWNERSTATGNNIRYRRIDKYGNTVIAPVLVSTATLDSGHTQGVPDVSADASGGAYVVWRGPGRTTSYHGIWLARIEPSGKVAWKKMVLSESNTTYDILDPRVSTSANGLVHVVCWKTGSPSAIYYAAFRPDGNEHIGWTALASSSLGGQRKLPNVEVDSVGRVHIVWFDAVDHPGTSYVGYRELYYTRLVYSGAYVSDPGASATIDRKRLTTTTNGYSPANGDAAEIAVDGAGTVQIAWTDRPSAGSSRGIRYVRLNSSGVITAGPKLVINGSTSSSTPLYARFPAIAALPGGGARIVAAARAGSTSPNRLWQVDINTAGTAGTPFCISNSGGRTTLDDVDDFASLGTDSGGATHLVFLADSGAPLNGAIQHRLTYKDLVSDPASNDPTRPDLQIDAAHIVHASSPVPPRQNTPVTVKVEVRNAGWVPIIGGSATLWFEGVQVGVPVSIPTLMVEETRSVSLPWTVPDDATRTPAALVVGVAAPVETTQTTSTNDTASVPLTFLVPPTETALVVEVMDETYDEFRSGKYAVPTSTVTLSGTTQGGAPYTTTGTQVGWRHEFQHVPLGTYTVSHAAPGYVISAPATKAVSITRDPGDRYRLITTPSSLIQLWANRWGAIEGTVTQSGGTTPVVGVEVTLLESGATSTTAGGGFYRYGKLCEGPVTIKAKKVGYERKVINATVLPAVTVRVDVSMVPTTTGYLVGAVTDDGDYPIPGSTLRVRRTGYDRTFTLPDGRFDIPLTGTVPGLTYTLDFSATGYLPKTGETAVVIAGEETDGSNYLAINIGTLKHKTSPERWLAPWTMKANWFGGGFSYGDVELESFDIMQWYGLNRFTFDADYQRAGTSDYIRYVKPRFVGEMFSWTYFFGVDPPTAPKVFKYEQDLLGLYDDRFQPPMLAPKANVNRTGVRIDGIDIVDQRDGSVVSTIRAPLSSWDSCDEPNGHLYGTEDGGLAGDGQFRYGSVPFNQQVVRLWITIGRMNEDGDFESAPFAAIDRFNQGQLLQASGYRQLALYWRPDDNYMWAEPALIGYPNP